MSEMPEAHRKLLNDYLDLEADERRTLEYKNRSARQHREAVDALTEKRGALIHLVSGARNENRTRSFSLRRWVITVTLVSKAAGSGSDDPEHWVEVTTAPLEVVS